MWITVTSPPRCVRVLPVPAGPFLSPARPCGARLCRREGAARRQFPRPARSCRIPQGGDTTHERRSQGSAFQRHAVRHRPGACPDHRQRVAARRSRRWSSASGPCSGSGTRRTASIYRFAVRPRLGPPGELEAEAPPRFAQAVGLVFAVIGVIGYAVGRDPAGHGRGRGGARRGVPQRSLRLLPGLRDVSAYQTNPAGPPGDGRRRSPTRRLLHEPFRRPGGRRLGGGPRGRPGVVACRGGRGHQRLRHGAHQGRDQDRLEEGPAGPGPPGLRGPGRVRGAAVRARDLQRRHGRSCTAGTTTGSRRTRTGTSSCTGTRT